jgi:hypothetical protein
MAGALVGAAACTPNNSVKPGAPELIEFIIGTPSPVGFPGPPVMGTTVRPDTPDCVSGIMTGSACLPMGQMADADGGMDLPADGLCRDVDKMNWCSCNATSDDGKTGAWDCSEFSNVFAVIAVFDRLLDTSPFDAVDAGPIMDSIVTLSASSGAPAVALQTNYSATGSPNGLIFNLYGPFFGNLRADGPSLLSAPQPEFPSGATVTVTLDANQVHAKDGTTPFTGQGPLTSGTLVFKMAPFSASFAPPDPMRYGADPNAAVVTFTNFVDTATAPSHITATVDGAAAPVNAVSNDGGANFLVTPVAGAGVWPSGATVVISVDAAVTNLLGQPIAAVAPFTFTAP